MDLAEKNQPEDTQLVTGVSNGDQRYEQQFALKFRDALVRMLNRLTRDSALAEDLAHDALMLVIGNIRKGRINHPDRLTHYVFSTARFLFLGSLRRADNQVVLKDAFDDIAGPTQALEQELLDMEARSGLEALINRLGVQRDREVLSRFYLYEQNKPEICEALSLSAIHHDRVISRARKRLRSIYESHDYAGLGVV